MNPVHTGPRKKHRLGRPPASERFCASCRRVTQFTFDPIIRHSACSVCGWRHIDSSVGQRVPPQRRVLARRRRPLRQPPPTEPASHTRRGARSPAGDAYELLGRAFDTLDRGDGIAHLAALGEALHKLDPAFNTLTYGKAKLIDLFLSLPEAFEIERRTQQGTGAVYVRRRKAVPEAEKLLPTDDRGATPVTEAPGSPPPPRVDPRPVGNGHRR